MSYVPNDIAPDMYALTISALSGAAVVIPSVLNLREMWAVLFVGSLCSFITPVFSSFSITNESYIWLDSLDACNKINMKLASRKSVLNSTFLSPSETEAYWIQELEIIKMYPIDGRLEAYNAQLIGSRKIRHRHVQLPIISTKMYGPTLQTLNVDNLLQLKEPKKGQNMMSLLNIFQSIEDLNNALDMKSFRFKINGENVQQHCTQIEQTKTCTKANNDSSNLMRVDSFSTILALMSERNTGYRIGYVNYTSIVNGEDNTTVISCVLYYQGCIFSDECSNKRRALCDKGEFQYDVSRHGGEFIPRYRLQATSTIGVSTTIFNTTSFHTGINITNFKTPSPNHGITIDLAKGTTTLYIIIGASVSGVIILGLVILSCTVCLCRRQTSGDKPGHKSTKQKRKSDKMDMFETYSEVADSIARPEISQDPSTVQAEPEVVQYSTPEDAVKFAMTRETEEFANYAIADPNKKINMSKTNRQNPVGVNIYQQVNIEVDTNFYDTTNYQQEKAVMIEPTYDHVKMKSDAQT